MSDRENKPYAEWKKDLANAFYRAANHPEYVNKTYTGEDFYDALKCWEDAWFGLIYHSTDFNGSGYWDNPALFEYKITLWCHWDHNFNYVVYHGYSHKGNYFDQPFKNPDFLDGIFDITYRFINAKTREEESKALDTCYMLSPVERKQIEDGTWRTIYKANKYLWLTEENTGIKSSVFPTYLCEEVKNIYNLNVKKHLKEYEKSINYLSEKDKQECVAYRKELIRVQKILIKKGILKDVGLQEK